MRRSKRDLRQRFELIYWLKIADFELKKSVLQRVFNGDLYLKTVKFTVFL